MFSGKGFDGYPLVLFVVPNKDGIQHLSYSLPCIYRIQYPNLRVIVVDNCSKDNSLEYVKKNYPEFEIIQNDDDLGFAGSVNRGILHGLSINAHFVVVFSNDVRVHAKWLSHSLTCLEDRTEFGIVGFIERNGPYQDSLVELPNYIETEPRAQPSCVAVYILKTSMIRKVGLFDEGYYMYGEDNDFFFRCKKAGYVTFQTNIPVWHHGEGFTDSTSKQKLVTRYVYRNWLRFTIKNRSVLDILVVLCKMVIYAWIPNGVFRKRRFNRIVDRLVRFPFPYRTECLISSVWWNAVHIKRTKWAKFREREFVKRAVIQNADYSQDVSKPLS